MSTFVLKGNIIYSKDKDILRMVKQGYLVCKDGISKGVYEKLPVDYEKETVREYGDKLILPGLTDLHLHAPQYAMRANGMDMELLDWLSTYTFPTERRYRDLDYAKAAYGQFADALKKSPTTRACVFGTIHVEATKLLMELLENAGTKTYVGKVNMDRNCPDYLCEEGAEQSIEDTKSWITAAISGYKNVKPILTPRFVPTCSDLLMEGLGKLQKEFGLPLQSHLSENESEAKWVKDLCPNAKFYGDAYNQAGIFGTNGKTVMAHCVHSTKEEVELMKQQGVFIAHCPLSNTSLSSGIAPAKEYLKRRIPTGLGTDIAGGYSLSIFRVMAEAIQASKLRWKLKDESLEPLTLEEAFYMGTIGGGAFFGRVGSFEPGYELDAVILDDSNLMPPHKLDLRERLERIIYLSDDRQIYHKYVAGKLVYQNGSDENQFEL